MKLKTVIKLSAALAMLGAGGHMANAQVWLGGQLGSPAYQGSVTTNGSTLTILAGGDDIWNNSDNGYFYYTWAQGNWDAQVRVDSLDVVSGGTANEWRKAEMMVRWSDPAVGVQGGDGFIATMLAPQQTVGSQYRPYRGAGASDAGNTGSTTGIPRWLRLTRTNNVFQVLNSTDGTTWITNQTIDVSSTANGFGRVWPDLVTVGVAITAHDNDLADAVSAVVSQPTIASSKPGWIPPTAAGIKNDIASKTVFEGGEAAFTIAATNNASPVTFPHQYQWYRNGTAVAGLTKDSTAFLATPADNGATFYCVSWPVGYPAITVTSAVATLTVNNSGIVTNGYMKLEVFAGSSRADVYAGNVPSGDSGAAGIAGKLRWLDALEDPANDPLYGDNTSRRLSGWFVPAVSGNYEFYVASDDDTDVWLGTSADPSTKRIICQEMGWSGYNSWTDAGGDNAADDAQKCSNTWIPNGATEPANPNGIALIAGTRYYLDMVVHNGGGGDNASLTAQLFDTDAPTNGQPTELRGNVLQLVSWQPTTFAWTQQPLTLTAPEGSAATFRAVATSDGEFAPHYQWLRGGVPVAGATTSSISIDPAQLTDSGAQFACVATIPMMNAITSQVATLTVQQAVFEPGFMLNQKWLGVQNRANAAAGTLGDPTMIDVKPGMAAAITSGEAGANYTRKISGFFIPPATDRYHFYTTSDDQSDLYISLGNAQQSANPANKVMVAQESQWSSVLRWGTSDGTSIPEQKVSTTWTNASGVRPYETGIQLTAGQRYYMEVDQQEGSGGDNLAVTYRRDGDSYMPAQGDQPRMVGSVIGFQAPQCQKVWFTLQPTNPPAILAGPNTATFYAFGSSDSTLQVGNITGDDSQPIANPQVVFFQWKKNGVDIPGATTTSYTTPWLTTADNGAQFSCAMRALGYGTPPNTRLWSNSEPATLTVTTDTTVPQVTYSGSYPDPVYGYQFISLTFNTIMDTNLLANPANYSLGSGSVLSVEVNRGDARRVLLTCTGVTLPTTVTVSGLSSWSGVAMANASTPVVTLPLTKVDLGLPITDGQGNWVADDPTYPGKVYLDGPNAFTIAAQGSDIWGTADGFTFLYEQKNGDFDVVLRQNAYSLPNRWAKVGLMMRDSVDTAPGGTGPGSRNWNIVNDPPNVPTLSDGNGANAVECNWREVHAGMGTNANPQRGSDSAGWGSASYTPQYPNAWIRLKRAGQVVSAYAGTDGMNWTQLASMDVSTRLTNALPNSMYVGICVTAHHNDPGGIPYEQQQFWNYASVDSYNSSYVAPPPQQRLTATLSGQNVVVSWTPTGGTLYSSPDPSRPIAQWTAVGPANPATIPLSGGQQMFFRVVTPFNP